VSTFEAAMPIYNHLELSGTLDDDARLPRGISMLIIGALSVLSWMVLITLFMALRAIV
jgi:hypothetical protein